MKQNKQTIKERVLEWTDFPNEFHKDLTKVINKTIQETSKQIFEDIDDLLNDKLPMSKIREEISEDYQKLKKKWVKP